jgi:hypothetical protein
MRRPSHAAVALGSLVSEKALLEQVRQLARMLGWMTYHPHLSRWSERGFPDVTLVKPPRLVFLELKSQTGRVSTEQAEWLAALNACDGIVARVIRPSDFDDVVAILRGDPA